MRIVRSGRSDFLKTVLAEWVGQDTPEIRETIGEDSREHMEEPVDQAELEEVSPGQALMRLNETDPKAAHSLVAFMHGKGIRDEELGGAMKVVAPFFFSTMENPRPEGA